MRVLFLVLICCMSFSALGQIPRSLTEGLNSLLKDELVRGVSFGCHFTVQQSGEISFQKNGDERIEQIVPKIEVFLTESHVLTAGTYYLHMYWDLYSSQAYTSIGRVVLGGFPNYTNIFSSPRVGNRLFVKTLLTDLRENGFNFGRYNGDIDKLEVYVDEKGATKFMGSDRILPYLGRVKDISWLPALNYGKVARSIFTVKLINIYSLSKDTSAIDLAYMPEIFVMGELFDQNLVKIQSGTRQVPLATYVVSFVLNAASGRFENPMIHSAYRHKAAELINFINKNQPLDINFYWKEYPMSGRYYFYINEF